MKGIGYMKSFEKLKGYVSFRYLGCTVTINSDGTFSWGGQSYYQIDDVKSAIHSAFKGFGNNLKQANKP